MHAPTRPRVPTVSARWRQERRPPAECGSHAAAPFGELRASALQPRALQRLVHLTRSRRAPPSSPPGVCLGSSRLPARRGLPVQAEHLLGRAKPWASLAGQIFVHRNTPGQKQCLPTLGSVRRCIYHARRCLKRTRTARISRRVRGEAQPPGATMQQKAGALPFSSGERAKQDSHANIAAKRIAMAWHCHGTVIT